MIELYRAMVPAAKLINDNHSQHYRTMMGQIEWLGYQFDNIFKGVEVGPGNFTIPDVNVAKAELGDLMSLRCEVWRCRNLPFDPHNYAKTFKASIDLLVKNGYIPDDNWKVICGSTYIGGGRDVWHDRAVRYQNDGLPDDLSPEWWHKYSGDYNDLLIRVIAKNERM
jgi:hypothetical protein